MKINVARRPRFQRLLESPTIRLTDRDKAILSAVVEYRFLTTSLILLLVTGSKQNIRRRLQRLYHAGFLDRPRAQLPLRYAGELFDFVYSSTRKTLSPALAFSRRTVSGKESKKVSSLFLAHALSVSEAQIRIRVLCLLHGLAFISQHEIVSAGQHEDSAGHLHWRVALKADKTTENVGVIPDAVFSIEQQELSGEKRRLYYFLEADRGTMPLYRKSLRLSSIRRKTLSYLRSRRMKLLKEHYNIPGFQVLFVARTTERLERIKEVCTAATDCHSSSLFLFTTQDELQAGNLPPSLGMV